MGTRRHRGEMGLQACGGGLEACGGTEERWDYKRVEGD